MWITVKTNELPFKISMPVPLRLAGFVIKMIPESVFYKMTEDVPAPYEELISKENFCFIFDTCMDTLREHKGLEVVHVDASDGTFISIRL